MKHLWLAALLLVDPRPVSAGHSCGGGGGSSSGGSSSGGSSSGGSSSGGGSSYSSSSSDTSSSEGSSSSGGCSDGTDVHGYRHCTRFGAWGRNMRLPRIFFEAGTSMRSFPSALGGSTGSIQHGAEAFSYRVVMPTSDGAQRDVAVMSNLRVGFGISRHLYSGLEIEFGGLASPASANAEMTSTGTFGSPNVEQQHGIVAGVAAIGGYRISGGRGSLAIEGAGGERSVSYHFASAYHDCETSSTITAMRTVVEARARAELWLSPWVTAGVSVGSNVLQQSDWNAGLYLGLHTRAFAGSR